MPSRAPEIAAETFAWVSRRRGYQIIGRRYADADVLAASAGFEQLRPWAGRHRACAKRELA
jgi:hypothetical protein